MSKPNQEENTLMSWATGYCVMYAIGIAAGIFIYKSGLIQTVTDKILSKSKSGQKESD